MGSAEGATSSVRHGVGGTVGGAGQSVTAQTQGNPLAAGLVALGAGWLLGSLLPATSRERAAAATVKDQAAPLADQVQQVAKETAEHLKEPAMKAADSVKGTAQEAAENVKGEGQSAATDVRSSAEGSVRAMQEHREQPGTSL